MAAVKVQPQLGSAHAELGRVLLYGFGRASDAIIECKAASALGMRSETTIIAWAHALTMVGRHAEARDLLVQERIDHPFAYVIIGDAFRVGHQPREALAYYRKAELSGYDNPWFFHSVALAYVDLGDEKMAVAYWQRALGRDPLFGPALEGLRRLGCVNK
jgi:tetratricopeptide (TPR) repeat protein